MLKQISVFFLVGWILLNAVGIRVFRHTCRESGRALVSVFEKSGTCHEQAQEITCCKKKTNCHQFEGKPRISLSQNGSCCTSASEAGQHHQCTESPELPPCCEDYLTLYQAPVHKIENFSFFLKLPVFYQKHSITLRLRTVQKVDLYKSFCVLKIGLKYPSWLINNILRL